MKDDSRRKEKRNRVYEREYMKKKIKILVLCLAAACLLSGCALFRSKINELSGWITGNTYECQFYSNEGEKFMTLSGQKINLSSNIVKELSYFDDGTSGYTKTMSSVVTITVDGKQVENCGSTVLFIEKGLTPDVDFRAESVEEIQSQAHGLGDNTLIANVVNRYKNAYGKPTVVVIQSQLGDPICAFSGDHVYWEVCEDLPKTTKLMIDKKALYIHRANFQIIDSKLLE